MAWLQTSKARPDKSTELFFRKENVLMFSPNALFLRENLIIVYFVTRLFKETELVHTPFISDDLSNISI